MVVIWKMLSYVSMACGPRPKHGIVIYQYGSLLWLVWY